MEHVQAVFGGVFFSSRSECVASGKSTCWEILAQARNGADSNAWAYSKQCRVLLRWAKLARPGWCPGVCRGLTDVAGGSLQSGHRLTRCWHVSAAAERRKFPASSSQVGTMSMYEIRCDKFLLFFSFFFFGRGEREGTLSVCSRKLFLAIDDARLAA
jgi:hypothetical protein